MLSLAVGILLSTSYVPYILEIYGFDITGRHIQPRMPSKPAWIIFFSLSVITFLGMLSRGVVTAQAIVSVCCACITLIVALRHGDPDWKPRHVLCLIGAAIGLLLWKFFATPEIGIVISCSISLFAVAAMAPEIWEDPWRESKLSWTMGFVACTLQLFALQSFTVASATQTILSLIGEGIVAGILYLRTPLFYRIGETSFSFIDGNQ